MLATQRDGDYYSRKIVLHRQSDGRVVLFGIPRLNLRLVDDDVRREILSQNTPLGRVLIEHNVLREVQLASLYRVEPGPDLCRLFGLAEPRNDLRPHRVHLLRRLSGGRAAGDRRAGVVRIINPCGRATGIGLRRAVLDQLQFLPAWTC